MIPGSGRFPGGGNLLQYSCLENSMDKGAWWAIVHRAAKSQTLLSDLTISLHFWLDRVMLKVLSNAEPIETQTCFISITFCETFCENLATDWAFRNCGWFPKLPRRNGEPTNAIIENQDIIMKKLFSRIF